MRRALTMLLLLAGCTTTAMNGDSHRDLAAQLAGRVVGPPQDCVDASPSANLRPVDEHTVTLESGGTLYVNHLMGECPGMRQMDTLIIQASEGARYCRGDRFRTVPYGGGGVPGPICGLGSFIPYRRAR